jgi:hypothetical protein
MYIVAVEQDAHSAQGYADPGSIRVQVNVIVRHCDVGGVLPKTNRSLLKSVSRPDSVLAVALAKLLLDIGAVNSRNRVSGEGEGSTVFSSNWAGCLRQSKRRKEIGCYWR